MNEDLILSIVKPYVKDNSITEDQFNDAFSFLSKHEQSEVAAILERKSIHIQKLTIEYEKIVEPYVINGYLSYDDFEKIFNNVARKKQYEIVEYLFSLGIELADLEYSKSDIKNAELGDLLDPKSISIEEKALDENNYDDPFLDKTSDHVVLHSPHQIKQSNTILCKLIQEGNQQAKQDLCIKNQGLVRKYANAYLNVYGNDLHVEDLEQMGYLGLLVAAEKFDFSYDNAFSTYAIFWIKQSISRSIADYGFTIRLPVHILEDIIRCSRLDNHYDQEGLDYQERIEAISDEMNIEVRKVEELFSIRKRYMNLASLNVPVGDDNSNELKDILEDTQQVSIEDQAVDSVLSTELEKVLSTLTAREEQVIRLRFGIGGECEHTLEQIGELLNLTRERIRQIENLAMRKMRHPYRLQKLKGFLQEE